MKIRIAFLPLTDAAPLVAARELGYFKAEGLDVDLLRQASWASVRDLVQTRRADGAQMLATMPLALAAGTAHARIDVVTGLVLSLNGNAISVSENLFADLDRLGADAVRDPARSAAVLKTLVEQRQALGKPRLCFASVYPSSTHAYLLRHWMSLGGIDPDRDIRMVVIPPPRMVESLASGLIDGCCVGEPWNSRAAVEGAGRLLLAACDLWNNAPEKVLAVRRDWLADNRDTYHKLIRAIVAAGKWADIAENRMEVARLLSLPDYVDLPEEVIAGSLAGHAAALQSEAPNPDFHVFSRHGANYPRLAHVEWYLAQMQRWGHLAGDTAIADFAASVYLPAEFEKAMAGSAYLEGLQDPDAIVRGIPVAAENVAADER